MEESGGCTSSSGAGWLSSSSSGNDDGGSGGSGGEEPPRKKAKSDGYGNSIRPPSSEGSGSDCGDDCSSSPLPQRSQSDAAAVDRAVLGCMVSRSDSVSEGVSLSSLSSNAPSRGVLSSDSSTAEASYSQSDSGDTPARVIAQLNAEQDAISVLCSFSCSSGVGNNNNPISGDLDVADPVASNPPPVSSVSNENILLNRSSKRKRPTPHRKVSFATLGRVISQRWKKISKENLEKYNSMAAIDKKRYQKEMKAYDKACVAAACMRGNRPAFMKQATSDLSSDSGSDGCSSERPKISSDSGGTSSGSGPKSSTVGRSCPRPSGGRKLSIKERAEKKSMNALRKEAKEAMRTANECLKDIVNESGIPTDAAAASSLPVRSAPVLSSPRQQPPQQAPYKSGGGAVSSTSELTGLEQQQQQQSSAGAAGDNSASLALAPAMMNATNCTSGQPVTASGTDFGFSQQQLALIGLQSLQAQAQQGLARNPLSNSQGPSSLGLTPNVPQVDASAGSQANGNAARDTISAASQGGFDLAFAMRIGYLAGLKASQKQMQPPTPAPSPQAVAPPQRSEILNQENAASIALLGALLGQPQQQQRQEQTTLPTALAAQPSTASATGELLDAVLGKNPGLLSGAPAPSILPSFSPTPSSADNGGSNAALTSLVTAMLLQQEQKAQQQAQAQAQAAYEPSVNQILAGLAAIEAQDQRQATENHAATNSGGLHRHTTHRRPAPTVGTAVATPGVPLPSSMAATATATATATGVANSTVAVSSNRTGSTVWGQNQSPPSSEISLSMLSGVASGLSDVASADSRGSSGSNSNKSGGVQQLQQQLGAEMLMQRFLQSQLFMGTSGSQRLNQNDSENK